MYSISVEGEIKTQIKSILQEKLVKEEPVAGKIEKDVPMKQRGSRRQHKERETADDSRRPKACRKGNSTGDCHHLICHMFQIGHSSTTIVFKSLVLFRSAAKHSQEYKKSKCAEH